MSFRSIAQYVGDVYYVLRNAETLAFLVNDLDLEIEALSYQNNELEAIVVELEAMLLEKEEEQAPPQDLREAVLDHIKVMDS
jgi:peptidoglycan hydrolase CwlO-like protein